MKTRRILPLGLFCLVASWLGVMALLLAQDTPRFTAIQPLTNKEVALTLAVGAGTNYRLDVSTNLPGWTPLVTLTGTTASLQFTDSAAPYLPQRFYRSEALGRTNLTGDHIATTNGDLMVHPKGHASFVMTWNGLAIYNDPTNGAPPYVGLPRADLVLVSHFHSDHFNTATIDAVRGPNARIVVPADVFGRLTAPQQAIAAVIGYGASTNLMGVNIQAVAAYNSNHPSGINNAYVLTLGGTRVFISGDTGNTAEMRAVPNIDVAFICMNRQFTMNWLDATNLVRAMRPKVVFPYHYREGNGQMTNAPLFKQNLGADLGIEVRLRKWY